jgi:hypothetical protein
VMAPTQIDRCSTTCRRRFGRTMRSAPAPMSPRTGTPPRGPWMNYAGSSAPACCA